MCRPLNIYSKFPFDLCKLRIPEFVPFIDRLEFSFLISVITLNITCVSATASLFYIACTSGVRLVVHLIYI